MRLNRFLISFPHPLDFLQNWNIIFTPVGLGSYCPVFPVSRGQWTSSPGITPPDRIKQFGGAFSPAPAGPQTGPEELDIGFATLEGRLLVRDPTTDRSEAFFSNHSKTESIVLTWISMMTLNNDFGNQTRWNTTWWTCYSLITTNW